MRSNHFTPPPHHQRHGRARQGTDMFGPDFGFEFGPGRGRPRGRRRGGRGGDVRAAALLLLDEQPRHGYDLIKEIGERSGGSWNPSPGSIYPVLQQLEDEGLIDFERVDGRKTASLTDAGTAHVGEHRDELGTPWEQAEGQRPTDERRALAAGLKGFIKAWQQVVETGTPAQQEAATAALDDARKAMYRILAGDEA